PVTSRSRSAMGPPALDHFTARLATPGGRRSPRTTSDHFTARLAAPAGRRSPRTTTDHFTARLAAPAAAAHLALPARRDFGERVQRPLDVVGVDVLVGHAADRRGAGDVDLDLAGKGALDELVDAAGALDVESDDVRLHAREID